MPQTPVVDDQSTPIFDALAAEVGLELAAGWFDSGHQSDGSDG